jgi:large subunit ribosomal protein L5
MNRLQKQYQDNILPALKKELNLDNDLAAPRLEKIVINMGIGDISKDKTNRTKIINYFTQIAGQKPALCPAKKAIAEFGIRQGDAIGIRATLRGDRMYQFLDKLISIVLPRVRDFQGIKPSAFDNQGNYNLGLTEQIIFPEVKYDTIDRVRGLQITIKIKNANQQSAYSMLKQMGMPFEKEENQ